MYHNVFRYETEIHLHNKYIFDTNNNQSEYAFLFPFSIYACALKYNCVSQKRGRTDNWITSYYFSIDLRFDCNFNKICDYIDIYWYIFDRKMPPINIYDDLKSIPHSINTYVYTFIELKLYCGNVYVNA